MVDSILVLIVGKGDQEKSLKSEPAIVLRGFWALKKISQRSPSYRAGRYNVRFVRFFSEKNYQTGKANRGGAGFLIKGTQVMGPFGSFWGLLGPVFQKKN